MNTMETNETTSSILKTHALLLALGITSTLGIPSAHSAQNNGNGSHALCSAKQLGNATKWFPGHYMRVPPARKYDTHVTKFLNNQYTTGIVLQIGWRVLEPQKNKYNFDVIERYRKRVAKDNKKLVLKIMERCFGRCSHASSPDYLKKMGGVANLYRNPRRAKPEKKGSVARIWEPEVADRLIKLYRKLGERYDRDMTIAGITIGAGESAIAVKRDESGYSRQKHVKQLKRMAREVKKAFPHTVTYTGINFLGGGKTVKAKQAVLRDLVSEVKKIGGGGVVHPDTIPPGSPIGQYGQKYYHFDVEREFRKDIAIFPQFQTALMQDNLTDATMYAFALNKLGAHAIAWDATFFSRKAKNKRRNYLGKHVLPAINQRRGRVKTDCPSTLKPCISQCRTSKK